jgi:hypothetical protein
MSICPKDCSNRTQIPYLSTNTKIHVRETVYEDSEIIIEDYAEDQEGGETVVLRQVIFPENPKVVQSEIPLIYKNTKSSKKAVSEEMKAESILCPPKKDR